jgi:hypothetical protein
MSGVAQGEREGADVSGTAAPPVRVDARASGPATRVRRVAGWIRRWYGANPLHLLALLAAFALAGYAVRAVFEAGQWTGFAEWFAVAIIGHDLLLFPLYSLADLSLRHLLPGGAHGRVPAPAPAARGPFEAFHSPQAGPPAPSAPPAPPAVTPRPAAAQPAPAQPAAAQPGVAPPAWPPLLNYVRIPVIFSLLLLLTFFPMILGLSERELHRASGLGTGPYLWRWLGVTGAMFAISAVCYALRTRRTARLTTGRLTTGHVTTGRVTR